jgi:hypothetical protein
LRIRCARQMATVAAAVTAVAVVVAVAKAAAVDRVARIARPPRMTARADTGGGRAAVDLMPSVPIATADRGRRCQRCCSRFSRNRPWQLHWQEGGGRRGWMRVRVRARARALALAPAPA